MKCNVCDQEARCYQLREVIGHPGMMMRGEGMIFCICSLCLAKLVDGIKTDATIIETPDEIPVSDRILRISNRSTEMHATAVNAAKSEKEPK